jgi:GNAT superfamily N-acetyltransferase
MTEYVVKPLSPETFPAWLALAEKHNGVWGGCWCSYFHGDTPGTVKAEHDGPTFKRRLVEEGVAHAALVFDGDQAIAWCQYDAGEDHVAPWRITCFFVDRDHRRKGVTLLALRGALDLIARAGGGEVVSFPNIVEPGKRVSSSFLHNVTPGIFEQAGFRFERRIGKNKTVMRTTVAPA